MSLETPGAWPFWLQGHNLNKLVEVYWLMLHTKYEGSRPCGFREDLLIFSPYIISLCKTFDPGAKPFLVKGILFEQTW